MIRRLIRVERRNQPADTIAARELHHVSAGVYGVIDGAKPWIKSDSSTRWKVVTGPRKRKRVHGPVLGDHRRVGKRFVPPFVAMLGTLNPVKWIDDLLPEMLWLGMLNNDHGHRRGIRVAIVTPAVRTHRDDAEDRVPFVKLGKYVLRPRGWRVVAHAPVMPEQRDLYKSEPSKIAIREWPCEARTR